MHRRVTDEGVALELTSSSRPPYTVRRVPVPPKADLCKEISTGVKETFFADDPLRKFKNKSLSTKFILFIYAVFPIFEWGRSYSLKKFKGDLVGGLTIASLCIPQDIAYAKLAGVQPQYGLCKLSILLTFVYLFI